MQSGLTSAHSWPGREPTPGWPRDHGYPMPGRRRRVGQEQDGTRHNQGGGGYLMSAQLISIYALCAMFVVATILPVNMGVLAFAGAFLVGTLVAGMSTKDIIAGFPGGLFLTLVGITYLFALA